MSNDGARIQIQDSFLKVVEDFKNPDPRKKLKEKRQLKKQKVARQYGL